MENTKTEACYRLLQKVLFEAFQTETLYFIPPYKDLDKIDRGIRNIMWPNFLLTNSIITPTYEDPMQRFLVIRSNLGFYNILIYLTLEAKPEFLSIGPFRAEEFSMSYFMQIVKDLKIPSATMHVLTEYYNGLPYVPLSSLINVTMHILKEYYQEFENLSPVFFEFSNKTNKLEIDQDLLWEVTSDHAELFQKQLLNFQHALKSGDSVLASRELKEFLVLTKILSFKNLGDCKKNLHFINSICQLALLETQVHPLHIMKLSASLTSKIDNITSRDSILSMPNTICHKYCLLVNNYSYQEYSKTARSVISYITLHLHEDLNLSLIAEHLQKNATTLSFSFSKEVGVSITHFIHQTRINEAIRLFNTTKMSISEVALTVGFKDFAYFSRLFKKQIGLSPREYCRTIK